MKLKINIKKNVFENYDKILKTMKITIVILFICTFNLVAGNVHSQNEKLSLKVTNTTIESAIAKIEKENGYVFIYNEDVVPELKKQTSLQAQSEDIGNVLDRLFNGTDLAYNISGKQVVVYKKDNTEKEPTTIPSVIHSEQQNQQTGKTITGKVVDVNGEPIIGATIIVQGDATKGTVTDIDGNYTLTNVPDNATLNITYVGMQPQTIALGGRATINITLVEDMELLDEVVVVGYGTQLKSTVTGSIKLLYGEKLSSQASINTSAALMGKIPGVQIIQNSGQPGENTGTIRIRGIGTLGDSSPLVLIDGVPGNINNVPSLDIENITVLKDAASAAVYGSRAANGVILVTTKRGKVGKPRISYQTFVSLQSPTNQPEFVDGATFMTLQNLGLTNVGSSPVWSDNYINDWKENHNTDPDNYPNTNWVNEAFSKQGIQQRHALSISGGTNWINYLSSLSFDDEQSSIPNYGFKRYSFRINSDVQATNELNFNMDVNISRLEQTNPSQGISRIITDIYRIPAVYTSKYSHGGWGPAFNLNNPVAYIHDGGLITGTTTNYQMRLGGTFEPKEGLTFSLFYSPVQMTTLNKRMIKQYEITDENGEITQMMPERNGLTQEYSSILNHNVNAVSNYKVDTEKHQFSAMAGYEFISSSINGFSASRNDFQIQDLEELNAGSVSNQLNSGSASEWSLLSFFTRLNYGYQRKYLIEGNLRYDGSSRFEDDKKWSLFPSFSMGWVVSEENFMKDMVFLNLFKIRGSWGILGNQEIGNYPFVATMNLDQGYLFGSNPVSGAAQTSLSNPNITWERTENSNIGVDLSLLNNRLNFTYDYYIRNTSGILLRLPVPLIIGLTAPYQNAGEVRNAGSEFEISFQNSTTGGLSYSSSFNISYVKNRIINLVGSGPFISGSRIDKEGYPINSLFGYRSLGLFQSVAEIENHAQQIGQIAPGDIKYEDINNDGVINADDRTIIGDPFPALNYGLDLTLGFKGFDLSVFFQGVGKRDVLLTDYAAWPLYNGSNIRKWQAKDYWTTERPNASMPRLTAGTSHNNFEVSDFWVYNASYIRLRNIQIGYTIPEEYASKFKLTSLRLFLIGENIFTLSKMPDGVDPNVPNGSTFFPISKLYGFGININL